MKKLILHMLSIVAIFGVISCGYSSYESSPLVDSLNNVISKQKAEIKSLSDTIDKLKVPADQRFAKALDCFANNNLDEAENYFQEIKELFPLSEEAKKCDDQLLAIAKKREEIEAEKERIKALGFKALKPVLNATISDVSVAFSGFSIGKEFVHDTYPTYTGSQWFYNTADKNNKFITCSMSATSKNSDPLLPTLAIYSIHGDKLEHEGDFRIEFARWDDYGSYLGNEPDNHNDFAKVNTVKFKLGCEVSADIFAKPYIVVLKLSNTQERNYDRFRDPAYWYSGTAGYPSSLSIEDFNSDYKAVKISNL